MTALLVENTRRNDAAAPPVTRHQYFIYVWSSDYAMARFSISGQEVDADNTYFDKISRMPADFSCARVHARRAQSNDAHGNGRYYFYTRLGAERYMIFV